MTDPQGWTYRDSTEAFDDAIKSGFLTDIRTPNDLADRYAGNWMYMGTTRENGDAFKNIARRNYIYTA